MLSEQFRAAVAGARYPQIEPIGRDIWRAHGNGLLSDDEAQSLAEALQARRRSIAANVPTIGKRLAGGLPCRSAPQSSDRAKSIMRRRSVAACGAVPSSLAAAFTLSEVAVLSVVAGEVKRRGRCELPIDAIAGRAGTSRTVVKRALRAAAAAGLVTVRERRRAGLKSLPNVVAIVSIEWRAWLRLADRGPKKDHREYQLFIGSRNTWAHGDKSGNGQRTASVKRREGLFERTSRSSPPS